MMVPLLIAPFASMMVLFSPVSRIVLKICTSSTTPFCPPASIKSPVLKGLNTSIKTPPAKLARDPCKARPTAKPMAPMMATKEVVSMPNIPATVMSNNTFKPTETMLDKNDCKEASTLRFVIVFLASFDVQLIMVNPMMNTNNAEINFGPKPKIQFCNCVVKPVSLSILVGFEAAKYKKN